MRIRILDSEPSLLKKYRMRKHSARSQSDATQGFLHQMSMDQTTLEDPSAFKTRNKNQSQLTVALYFSLAERCYENCTGFIEEAKLSLNSHIVDWDKFNQF